MEESASHGPGGPSSDDTIAAISTAPGRAGIAMVRISGPGVPEVARRLGLEGLEPRRATYRAIRHPEEDRVVDRGVAIRYVAPASYTGEEMLELSCHGGSLMPQLVLDAACAAGARPAEAGEFTRRAYLNGKMDFLQVEATLDLVDAPSEALGRAALFQLDRGLSRRIEGLRESLLGLQALMSYDIDFPEEDEGPVPPERIDESIEEVLSEIEGLLRHAPEGELLRHGALTVVAGRPNVGKSSLYNALLGQERAIVTEIPGTTRDALEAMLSVKGYPFRLVDTAGLREEADRVEGLGIEVARNYLARADVVVFCAEAGRSLAPEERAFLARWEGEAPGVLRVRTKADLVEGDDAAGGDRRGAGRRTGAGGTGGGDGEGPQEILVSAREGRGLEELRRALLNAVYAGIRRSEDTPLVTRRRQRRALERAREAVEDFAGARRDGLPPEVTVVHLQEATRILEELLGVVDVEDVLDVLFDEFCVGK